MICIGITGGIGSGKSVVAAIFSSMGIPCYLADDAAKSLYEKDAELRQTMKLAFGEHIFKNEILDRAALAQIVFNNPDKLQQLNQLVHPAIGRDFQAWKSSQNTPIIAFESALLFQSEMGLDFDKSIAVTAPEDIRIARVCRRNNTSPEEVKSRMQHQWPQEKIAEKANFVLVNDNRQAILPQVLNILNQL